MKSSNPNNPLVQTNQCFIYFRLTNFYCISFLPYRNDYRDHATDNGLQNGPCLFYESL
jgi:hypothetical protein